MRRRALLFLGAASVAFAQAAVAGQRDPWLERDYLWEERQYAPPAANDNPANDNRRGERRYQPGVQTTGSPVTPAQMGITPTTLPEVLQVLDNTQTWVTIGTVDPVAHAFMLGIPQGGTGTATPGATAGPGISITGAWPNQTINNTSPGGAANSIPGTIYATQAGMAPGGQDNVPFISTLMTMASPPSTTMGGGPIISFPAPAGVTNAPYLFTDTLPITRGGTVNCGGYSGPRMMGGAILVFAAGVSGVRQEDSGTASDGGSAQSGILENCAIYSLGEGSVTSGFTQGNPNITVSMNTTGGLPASTWSPGDGFIAWAAANIPFTITNGSISGATVTVTTMTGNGQLLPGTLIYPTNNVLPNTRIASQTSGTPGGAGVYTLTLSQPATVTATSFTGQQQWWSPIVPPGAYVDSVGGTPSATTLTIHPGFEPTGTYTLQTTSPIYQLPAIQAYTVNTTAGSSTFQVTAGPSANPNRLLYPGSFVWSRDYPAGCVIRGTSGSYGAQSIDLYNSTMVSTTPCQATATETGVPLWVIPTAHRMNPQAQAWNNYYRNFPIGFSVMSSSGSRPVGNATISLLVKNTAENAIVGFIDSGNNTGGSTWINNEGIGNHYADFAALGSVGSVHVGDNSNSMESGSAPTTIVTNCTATAQSPWLGDYFGTPSNSGPSACLPTTGAGNGMIMTQTVPTGAGATVILFPAAGAFSDLEKISSNGMSNFPSFAFAPTNGSPGLYVNTTAGAIYNPFFSKDGTATHGIGYNYNSAIDTWQLNSANGVLVGNSSDFWEGSAYTGYAGLSTSVSYHGFMAGFLLGGPGLSTGAERQIYAGTTKSVSASNKQGNFEFNLTPTKFAGWSDTADGANMTPAALIAGDSGGLTWPASSSSTTIASLPACAAGLYGYNAVITNGVAAPAYLAAVGATTGTSTRRVFCDNTNAWLYD